jgi:hypothetical protein
VQVTGYVPTELAVVAVVVQTGCVVRLAAVSPATKLA